MTHLFPTRLSSALSRSNVSMGLKELQSCRLVKLVHQVGDRRDYFEAPQDVWEIFRILMEEKRRREIDPTLTLLRDTLFAPRSEEHTSELQSLMRISYAVFCLKKTNNITKNN